MNNPLSSQVGALNGGADYKLGAFQQVLEQVFPELYVHIEVLQLVSIQNPDDNYFNGPHILSLVEQILDLKENDL